MQLQLSFESLDSLYFESMTVTDHIRKQKSWSLPLSILCTDPWNHAPRARPFVRIQCEVYANRIVSRHVSRVACPRYNPLNNFPNIQNDPIQDLLHCSARGHTIYRTGTKIYILRN